MFEKKFLTFHGTLYIIRKVVREDQKPIIDTWKAHLGANMVLKRDGLLYFLEEVPDLQTIE